MASDSGWSPEDDRTTAAESVASDERPGAHGDGARDPWTRAKVEWPTGVILLRQVGLVAVAVIVWSAAFSFSMNLPTESAADIAAAERRAERRAAAQPTESAGESMDGDAASSPTPETTAVVEEDAPPETAPTGSDSPPPPPTRVATATPEDDGPDEEVDSPAETAPGDPIVAMSQDAEESLLPDVTGHPTVSFQAEVLPILESRCIECHGGMRDDGSLRIEEGLDLRTIESILAGSTWGSVVEPGDPVGSYMLELVADGDMPDEGPRLLPGEVRTLTAWVAQGAGG